MTLALVVEGDGEVEALPLLVRTFATAPDLALHCHRPLNALGRGNLIKPGGIERFATIAATTPQTDGVLVLLDAEAPCGSLLALSLAHRLRVLSLKVPVAIVVAVHMYEAWFLASASTLAGRVIKGRPGLVATARSLAEAEAVHNPKRWIIDHFPPGRGYHETQDQPAMTAWMDFEEVRRSCRSFRRLEHALLQVVDASSRGCGRGFVTP